MALPQLKCQLHDHAKQYDNDGACHSKWNDGKLHGNISRNGYGNAMIGRYGGFSDEGIWWVYDTGERCVVLEGLAMVEGRKVTEREGKAGIPTSDDPLPLYYFDQMLE